MFISFHPLFLFKQLQADLSVPLSAFCSKLPFLPLLTIEENLPPKAKANLCQVKLVIKRKSHDMDKLIYLIHLWPLQIAALSVACVYRELHRWQNSCCCMEITDTGYFLILCIVLSDNFYTENSETLKASLLLQSPWVQSLLGWSDIHESSARLVYAPPNHLNSIYRAWMCERGKISPILHH